MLLKNKTTLLALVALFGFTNLLSQTYTFTSAGATGRYGPTQSQVNTTYSNTSLNGAVTVSNGIQSWTVPSTGIYRIEAYGAKGGNGQTTIGGSGVKMQGDFTLTVGQVLKIVAGQVGSNGYQGGGGGGSFVTDLSNTPLIIAAGSGGAPNTVGTSYNASNSLGTTSTSAMSGVNANASVTAGAGGTAGNGGGTSITFSVGDGSGGGGLLSNGADGNPSTGGMAFVNGANGGAGATTTTGIGGDGGFGGGGGGDWSLATGSGGGGGYSGGGGGAYYGCGGGGGSYNSGANQSNTANVNAGSGYIVFTKITGVNIVQTTSIACYGQSTAVLTASAFGGVTPYTYSWTPNVGTGSVVSGLAAGSYTCRVVDANSAVYTNTFTISQPPAVSLAISSKTNVSCNGGSNGAITASVSGGAPPYSYTWSPVFAAGSTISNLPAGSYTCTIADANGCNTFTTVSITQPAPLSIIGIASTPTLCSGATCVLVGAGAQTYTWSGGVSNGIPFTPLSTANYTVIGSDAAGCTASAVTGVTVNPSPTVSIAGSASVCTGSTLVLTASGAPGYTWSTSSNASAINISPTITTSYTVLGANSNGCQNAAVKTVSVVNLTVVNANASSTAVCLGNPLTLYGTGAITYTWSGGVSNNISFTPSISDIYTVTGTGACGTASASISIPVNPLPVVTANASSTLVCSGNPVTLSGSGALTYNWSGGISNNVAFSPTATASYAVIGTDANGCQNTASKTVSVNPLPGVLANASSQTVCLGNPVTLFGSGANTYTWSSGVTNNVAFTPGATNSYTVTGTDLNGCQNTAVKTITVIGLPAVAANSSSSAVCLGNAVTLFGSGANSYTWSGGVSNNAAFTPTGTTTYTVTGSNACFNNTASISVTVNALPVVTANASSSVICFGNSTTLFGGGAATYTWSGGVTNNTSFVPTSSASYTVTGTGANGCQNTAVKSITVNPLPSVTASASNPTLCFGNTTTLNGGGAVTYTWTGGVSNNVAFNPTVTATYTVSGTDANGCQNTAIKTITVYALPVLTVSPNASVVCAGTSLILSASGANTYAWSGGISNGLPFIPTSSASYSVTGTNTLTGCSSTNLAVSAITVNPLPALAINVTNAVVCSGNTVSLSGSGANTYTWTGGVIDGVAFSPATSAVYTVTGTNTLTGCMNTATQNIVVNALPSLILQVSSPSVCVGSTVVLTATGANTYSWSNGVTNSIPFVPSVTTNYSVIATNTVTGCHSSATQIITVNPLPVLSSNATNNQVCAGSTVALNASGANTFTWSSGIVNGISFSLSVTASYSLSGTNTLTGCTKINGSVQTITVNALPNISINPGVPALCLGETANLSVAGALSYTWNTGSNALSILVTPTVTTQYSVSGTDVNACTNSAVYTQTVSDCLGISSFAQKTNHLTVFPNPNAGRFEISGEVAMELTILNELGQVVKTISLNSMNQNKIMLEELPNGIYFVIDLRKSGIKQKVIVNR